MSRSRWWPGALAGVVAVLAVSAGALVALRVYTHATVVTVEPIVGGALVAGRTVAVSAAAGCDGTDTLLATEQPGRVTLTLDYAQPRNPPCSGMPGFAVYRARLRSPLGHRRLVDSATGKPVPYFDANRLLRPTYLPPGYKFRYDAPNAVGLFGGEYLAVPVSASVSCSQIYAATESYDDLLVITQARGGKLLWPPRIKPQRLAIHGHPALAIPGHLSWAQDGQLIVLATSNPALHLADLIAVANSLTESQAITTSGQASGSYPADPARYTSRAR